MDADVVVFILIIVLVVLLALVLRASAGARAAAAAGAALAGAGGVPGRARAPPPRLALGGSAGHGAAVAVPRRAVGGAPPPVEPHRHEHGHFHEALYEHARALTEADVVGVHPTDADEYTAPARATGGTAGGVAKKTKHWTAFKTWDELRDNEAATNEYLEDRTAVLQDPNFDWGPVLAEMNPRLAENREYIGIINLDSDGRTLRIKAAEASPLIAGEMESETTFAAVPGELVEKYATQPALFLFHTHPADPRGSAFPSSHDLSTAVHFGATGRYAASVVISRYGVLAHGLDWPSYKAIRNAKNPKLAALNFSHDVVAAHESIRSWSTHTIDDYLAFYPRHRLLMFVYPSPEMVGDSRRITYLGSLEAPIDHELVAEHVADINEQRKDSRRKDKKTVGHSTLFSIDKSDVPLGFDITRRRAIESTVVPID
jgi:hypothetical protein